jgi:RNA polymerase sigma factor (sigma-70 family)
VTPAGRADIEAIWRDEAARVTATVARWVGGDLVLAEDLAQDAVVAALEQWPRDGVPPNPGAWLTATARHRAIDLMRRHRTYQDKLAVLARELDTSEPPIEIDDATIDDDVLALVFACCHPVLAPEARVALTLRLVGGLTTTEIARAFLVPGPTVGQRISRAKRTLAQAGVAFAVPAGDELEQRLESVLEVVYLVFNEGYAATAGEEWMRTDLQGEALRLGRLLAGVAPDQPEVHGLLALMALQASRQAARVGPDGEPVLLDDQDRSRWDRGLIDEGLAALDRAAALGRPAGPYRLQAEIAACHARARSAAETDWVAIAARYEALVQIADTPVVELNRAVALGRALGPEVGLAAVDALADEPALAGYHLLPAVRGDLLARLGRAAEARAEFARAAQLAGNARERALLLARARTAAASD